MNRPVKFLSDIFNVKPLTAEICLHTVFKPLKTVTYFREKESYLGEGISFLFFFFFRGEGRQSYLCSLRWSQTQNPPASALSARHKHHTWAQNHLDSSSMMTGVSELGPWLQLVRLGLLNTAPTECNQSSPFLIPT